MPPTVLGIEENKVKLFEECFGGCETLLRKAFLHVRDGL